MLSRCSLVFRFFIAVSVSSYSFYAYGNFATKTLYKVDGNPEDIGVENEFNSIESIDSESSETEKKMLCQAAHVSALIRHGARFPGLNTVHKILEIHKAIKDHLMDERFKQLKNWDNRFPVNNDKTLIDIGEDEQFHLGQRIANRFKSLFVGENIDDFRFLVSSKQRTQNSARAFFEGFTEIAFGEASDDINPELSDETLRFHERCNKFVVSVDHNESALHEYTKFRKGQLMQNIVNKIVSKYNLPSNVLSTGDIRTIFIICGYEKALFEKSPWCDMFDEEDFKVVEYLYDLKHYYKNAYGYDISREQSCPLIADMFETMDDTIATLEASVEDSDEEIGGYTVGSFYFGHAETIGPLYAALGLFNDSEPLRADNYDRQHNRLFRTSHIIPFSANILFALYECVDQLTENDDETTEYVLKLFVNEKVHRIPGCSDDHCSYEFVRNRYQKYIDECNFSEICAVKPLKDEL